MLRLVRRGPGDQAGLPVEGGRPALATQALPEAHR